MKYDAEYNAYVSEFASQNHIKNSKELITYFSLDKLYPEYRSSDIDLCKIGMSIFGNENFINKRIDLSEVQEYAFAQASNSNKLVANAWIKNAIFKIKEMDPGWSSKTLNLNALNEVLDNINIYTSTTTIEETKAAFELIANKIGINYYFCASIPNSRVKGVSLKTKEGPIFVLISDLFHCIENLWLTFIHELIHIKNNDFYNSLSMGIGNVESIEKKVENDVIELLTQNFQLNLDSSLIENAYNLSDISLIPVGIAGEIIRSITGVYNDRDLNSLIHIFKTIKIV